MKRLSLCAIVLALFAGTAAMLQRHVSNPSPAINPDARLNSNAAFRDGLYLGRLSAERGSGMNVASGRWATEADRASFKAGFQQGYQQFLASRRPAPAVARQTE